MVPTANAAVQTAPEKQIQSTHLDSTTKSDNFVNTLPTNNAGSAVQIKDLERLSKLTANVRSTISTDEFQLVVVQSDVARLLFRQIVSRFQKPRASIYQDLFEWGTAKGHMSGDESMEDRVVTPVLAMRGETACAAGLVSDASMNADNTLFLSSLVRNGGEQCRGGGSALLCHMIRNSQNREGEFSPLKVDTRNYVSLQRYFGLFGCTGDHDAMYCNDPNPPVCEEYDTGVVDAHDYFGYPQTSYASDYGSYFSAQMSPDVVNYSAMALIGFFVGCGIALSTTYIRSRCSSTASEQPLLAM
jgi:hypothetical protein